ncbi:MAG TPA: dipeptidase [Vicinamibacteria bacterium]|nr:dipeptidase [Vicinamibacteria bacterium]
MLALALAAALAASPAPDAALRARVDKVLSKTPLVDGHIDLPWAIRDNEKAPRDVAAYDLRQRTPGHTDLERLARGKVGGVFWSVYIPADPKRAQGFAKTQLEQIDIARQVIERYPERLETAWSADDVVRAFERGKVASLIGLEGGHAIENSLGALRAFRALGGRYMTLTHGATIDWADSATGTARHGGLSRFGEEVVREMNRLGMLVDLSHVSPEAMDDALRVSEAPVIFSHSSARAIVDHPRNVPDDILRKLPANGGVVMVTFVPSFVSNEVRMAYDAREKRIEAATKDVADPAEKRRRENEIKAKEPLPKATVAQVADHVEHVRRMAGVDHVGIGSDFDGIDEGPAGLEDVSAFPNLLVELARRGWSDADLARLAGGNILRVMRRAEEVAARLRKARPPSTATIEQLDGTPPAR